MFERCPIGVLCYNYRDMCILETSQPGHITRLFWNACCSLLISLFKEISSENITIKDYELLSISEAAISTRLLLWNMLQCSVSTFQTCELVLVAFHLT